MPKAAREAPAAQNVQVTQVSPPMIATPRRTSETWAARLEAAIYDGVHNVLDDEEDGDDVLEATGILTKAIQVSTSGAGVANVVIFNTVCHTLLQHQFPGMQESTRNCLMNPVMQMLQSCSYVGTGHGRHPSQPRTEMAGNDPVARRNPVLPAGGGEPL